MITIHKVQQADIPEVKYVLSHTWKDTYGSFLSEKTIDKVTTIWHDPEALASQAQHPDTYFAIAKDTSGKIVGLITVRKIDDKAIFMNRLYIHPDHQRQGIGSKLYESAIKNFPTAKVMRLEVEEENKKGLSFYLKQGFREVERKIDEIEGETLKTIVMEKTLD
jgi:ribosomal protein S18 acetylase RimI-like enzyme